MGLFFFFKQTTAYEMRISDWSSDVCSSDLWYRNNKLNENLVAWNDNSVSKLAELDPHKPEAAAGEMAGMVHGAMDHGNVDHAAMGHEAGATDMAMPGDAAHGDHMALMDSDERRARWALYAHIGLGLWLGSSPRLYEPMNTDSLGGGTRSVTTDGGLRPSKRAW